MTARLSLAEQLKALQDDAPKSIDPEEAYADLDGHDREGREGGREHYVEVGPSRLRAAVDADAAQTLLSDKYGGKASSRMKIFDDDEEEDEAEVADGAFDEDEDEDEGEGEEEGDEEDDEEEDDEEDEEDEDEEEEEEEDDTANAPPSGRTLDPVGALRASRAKDVEKGRGIKRQRDLFDSLLTLRITFQKALGAAFKLPATLPTDAAGEVEDKRGETLRALAALSDNLFTLREGITLPGSEAEAPRKRRRVGSGAASDAGSDAGSDSDADPTEQAYWTRAAADSFAIADAAHPALVPVLNKWSTKIHAASLSLAKPGAGGSSKFLASTRGAAAAVGVVDAIDAALAQRRDNPKPMLDVEESGYRALLREVIESRQGGVDVMHLRREKKKKREAERGGSKGRKLRYTVHDKAANFVVPVPLEGWHEEQIDELFSSLFGGVGAAGAVSAMPEARADEVADLGGLRVF